MTAARRFSVSYARFSDQVQSKGDSEDRQERDYREFCQRHNLIPGKEVFIDRGRSGYHDEHRKKGRLGQLIAAAKGRAFDPGTVIVIEAWDRLGRLRPDRQTELVAELLRTGVSIGVCRLNDIFAEEDFGTHKWTVLSTFIMLAFQESKQKADRVAASWEQRRQRARQSGRLLGCPLPAWVEVVNGEARLIPERAAAVKRIFELAAEGCGQTRIVQALAREKVPAFGVAVVRPGRKRSQFSGEWTRPYVALLLNDRRALGELQPTKGGKADGPPLAGYFPAVVSEDEFALARAGQERRCHTGNNSRQSKYVNVFKGILKHARDGEGWLITNRGTTVRPELVLLNTTGRAGRGRCCTFPYGVFEDAVLSCLKEIDPAEVLGRPDAGPSRAEALRAKLANVRTDIGGIQGDLKAAYSKRLGEVLREKEKEEEELAVQLQEELARSVRTAEKCWAELPGLLEAINGAADPEAARLKLRTVLRAAVEEVWLLTVRRGKTTLAAVQVWFDGAEKHRDYLILYRAATNHRKGGWWCRSLSHLAGPGDLDLRRREDAAELEELLAAIDLAGIADEPPPARLLGSE
jgi:DNA invertase Pin-like site-specific DNA recombinase